MAAELRREDKSTHNFTTKMNFSNKIVRLGHCKIVIMKIQSEPL